MPLRFSNKKEVFMVKKVFNNTLKTFEILMRAVRGIDYRTLNTFILKTNGLQEIDDILLEVSKCLKGILDYELFGFVIKQDDSLNVWIDPRAYKDYFINIIENDFNCRDIKNVHYFNTINDGVPPADDTYNMLSFKVMDNGHIARLYLMPRKKILSHHNEILGIITETLRISLENFFNTKKLQNDALLDPLTGCLNRRALYNYLDHDIAITQRYKGNLSIIMFDIDHFKKVNDTYGHQAGDIVLKEVVKSALAAIRKSDYLARYGGEEFVLVLPNTDSYNAANLAERLRTIVESQMINVGERAINITSSFGVATLRNGYDRDHLIQEADEMLYNAKSSGRNKVCIAEDQNKPA
jgi:diguanylate cyclase (GGDEF)-like protein